jgi:hypothetical protein
MRVITRNTSVSRRAQSCSWLMTEERPMETRTSERFDPILHEPLTRRRVLQAAGAAGSTIAVGALFGWDSLLGGRVLAQEEPGLFDDFIHDERGLLENGDFLMQLAEAGSVDFATGRVSVDQGRLDEVLAAFVPARAIDTIRAGLLRHARWGFAVSGSPEEIAAGRGAFVPWWLVGYLSEEGRKTLPVYVQRAILEDLGLVKIGSAEPVVNSPEEIAKVILDRFPNAPPGWFAVPAEAPPEPTPTEAAPAATLPGAFLGEWAGQGAEDNLPPGWVITITLTGGGLDEVVGSVSATIQGRDFRGDLILQALEPGSATLLLRSDEPFLDGSTLAIQPLDDGLLGLTWFAPDGSMSASGTLRRVGLPAKRAIVNAIKCRSEDLDCENPRLPDGLPEPDGEAAPTPRPGQPTQPGPVAKSLWDILQEILDQVAKAAQENAVLRCLGSGTFKNWWVVQGVCWDPACAKTIIDALRGGFLRQLGAAPIADWLKRLGMDAVFATAIADALAAGVAAAAILATALEIALGITPSKGACIVFSLVAWLFGFVGIGVMPNF